MKTKTTASDTVRLETLIRAGVWGLAPLHSPSSVAFTWIGPRSTGVTWREHIQLMDTSIHGTPTGSGKN